MTRTQEEDEILSEIRGYYRDALNNDPEKIIVPESLFAEVVGEFSMATKESRHTKHIMKWSDAYHEAAKNYFGKLASQLEPHQRFPPNTERLLFNVVIKDSKKVRVEPQRQYRKDGV